MRLTEVTILVLMVALVGCEERERPVAKVDGVEVLRAEVVVELRGVLWRSGETWGELDEEKREVRRQEAVDRCVKQRLMEKFAKAPAELTAAQVKASEDAFQQFLKQFEPPDGWQPRLELQKVGEVAMRERTTREVAQGGAIESWLQEQRKLNPEPVERAARAWFEKHREQWRVPDRARVSHVFLTVHEPTKPDRSAEIREIYRQLTAGEATLETLATKLSEDERSNKTRGSLGWVGRERLPGDFAEKVFSVPLKKVSEPFQTKLGWHIVLVHERKTGRWAEFEEVKEEVMARLDLAWREEAVKRLMEELRGKAKVEVDEEELGMVGVE